MTVLLLLLLVELEVCPTRRCLLFWSDMVDELVGVSLMLEAISQSINSVLVVIMVGSKKKATKNILRSWMQKSGQKMARGIEKKEEE